MVCIFIASITSKRSPFLTLFARARRVIDVTAPGIGAPTCPGLFGSAFARCADSTFRTYRVTVTSRG